MKSFKILGVLCVFLLVTGTALAGNTPEYDAVGCDTCNVFAASNYAQERQVVWGNWQYDYGYLNFYSWFPYDPVADYGERYSQTAGQEFSDPCFYYLGYALYQDEYKSSLTDAWNEAVYEWRIVLQMKPESDININIFDCVMKHNEFYPFTGAEQTGRYRAANGRLMWVPTANPSISAVAYPGPYATPGFTEPFTLDARMMPGLTTTALDGIMYTSKALWDESIIAILPETGACNDGGSTQYNLKQGDEIRVKVTIPYNNTCDIRYGKDNVLLKYIGIVGTWYFSDYADCWRECDFFCYSDGYVEPKAGP